jgi:GxxExxY protein
VGVEAHCGGEPQMDADERRLNGMTETIIGCAFRVANGLGVGFLEKVYENALFHELRKAGLQVEQQKAIQVEYDGVIVGNYVADLLVENEVIVELKAVKSIDDIHLAQCLNYLHATGLKVALILNFGTPRLGVKRVVNDF